MKLKASHLPFIGLGAGVLALLVRIWLFATGIDERGLLVLSHPGNILVYLLMALMLGLLLVTTYSIKETPAYSKIFKPTKASAVGCFAAAAGVLYTSLTELAAAKNLILVLACILGLAAAVCLGLTGLFRIKRLRPAYYFHAVVTAYFMFHILSQYQSWNIEPQLQFYFPQLLASVFLMATAYNRTALDAGSGKLRDYLFFNFGALFFSCIALLGNAPVFYLGMIIWTLTAGCPDATGGPAPMVLPENVQLCIRTLEKNGYTAYVVGGCVRDHLLGLEPHDYDMCTNAKPEQICALFEGYTLIHSGEKHGTVGVVIDGEVYEITTYRTEGGYSDNRHPDSVTFVDSIREDLARRDFTVNAMAYSPTRGYMDPFHGQADLKAKILRAVGDAETRFREDSLRILRGVRFAVRFRLTPEERTLQAMFRCTPLMENLAAERILTELNGLLPLVNAEDLNRYSPILLQIIPELAPCIGFDQKNPHHTYDIYTHIAQAVAAVPPKPALRLAALLHDIGKPNCFTEDEDGIGHFYGHAKISAEIADRVLTRLKVSTALREQVVFLVGNHMNPLEEDKRQLRRKLGKWGQEYTLQLVAMQKADLIATGTGSKEALSHFDRVNTMLQEIIDENSCLTVKDLAINGADLIEIGIAPGPQIGAYLQQLLEQVLDEALPNEKEALLRAVRTLSEN